MFAEEYRLVLQIIRIALFAGVEVFEGTVT